MKKFQEFPLCMKLTVYYVCAIILFTMYWTHKENFVYREENIQQAINRGEVHADNFDDMMRKVETMQAERQSQSRKACRELGYGTPTEIQQLEGLRTLIVYEPHKALICLMAKVASTSWKVELALLSNLTHIERNSVSHMNISRWHRVYSKDILKSYGIFDVNHYSDEEKLSFVKNYYSFMFTRHPLERQVSAYRSKFVIGNDATYSMFYSIVRGHAPPNKFNGTSDISFQEFITYVTNRLLNGKKVNEHMDTYERLCQPCVINYAFLGNMATMNEDVTYVITKMTGRRYTEHMFSMYSPEKTQESEKVYLNFYKDLDKDLVQKIDKAFGRDYRIFGYKTLWTSLGYDQIEKN